MVQSLGAIQAWAGGLKQGGTMGTEEEAHQGNQAGRPGVVCQCIEEGGGIWDDPEVLRVQETSRTKGETQSGARSGMESRWIQPRLVEFEGQPVRGSWPPLLWLWGTERSQNGHENS